MLSELSQTRKDTSCRIPLVRHLEKSIHRDRNWNGGFGGRRGRRSGGLSFNGYRVSALQGEKSSGDGLHNKCECLNAADMYI